MKQQEDKAENKLEIPHTKVVQLLSEFAPFNYFLYCKMYTW